eukprot:SAG11_NODE_3009_length_2769_cov_1.646816_4_plen_380_part_00
MLDGAGDRLRRRVGRLGEANVGQPGPWAVVDPRTAGLLHRRPILVAPAHLPPPRHSAPALRAVARRRAAADLRREVVGVGVEVGLRAAVSLAPLHRLEPAAEPLRHAAPGSGAAGEAGKAVGKVGKAGKAVGKVGEAMGKVGEAGKVVGKAGEAAGKVGGRTRRARQGGQGKADKADRVGAQVVALVVVKRCVHPLDVRRLQPNRPGGRAAGSDARGDHARGRGGGFGGGFGGGGGGRTKITSMVENSGRKYGPSVAASARSTSATAPSNCRCARPSSAAGLQSQPHHAEKRWRSSLRSSKTCGPTAAPLGPPGCAGGGRAGAGADLRVGHRLVQRAERALELLEDHVRFGHHPPVELHRRQHARWHLLDWRPRSPRLW